MSTALDLSAGKWTAEISRDAREVCTRDESDGSIVWLAAVSAAAADDVYVMAAAKALYLAVKGLLLEPLGDWVYDVREREMLGWDGPRVVNWSRSVQAAQRAVAMAEARLRNDSEVQP